jgi:hypothetical protein
MCATYCRFCGAACDDDNLGGQLLLLHADGLLNGDLVEWIHRVLDTLRDNTQFVGANADLYSIVNDALDTDENSKTHTAVCQMENGRY